MTLQSPNFVGFEVLLELKVVTTQIMTMKVMANDANYDDESDGKASDAAADDGNESDGDEADDGAGDGVESDGDEGDDDAGVRLR